MSVNFWNPSHKSVGDMKGKMLLITQQCRHSRPIWISAIKSSKSTQLFNVSGFHFIMFFRKYEFQPVHLPSLRSVPLSFYLLLSWRPSLSHNTHQVLFEEHRGQFSVSENMLVTTKRVRQDADGPGRLWTRLPGFKACTLTIGWRPRRMINWITSHPCWLHNVARCIGAWARYQTVWLTTSRY